MRIDFEFVLVLALWALGLALLLWKGWRGRTPVVGLVLGYFLQLFLIHGIAGYLQLVPAPWTADRNLTMIGFKVTGFAIAGLLVGALLVAPWLYRTYFKGRTSRLAPGVGGEAVADCYILVGLACFTCLRLPVGQMPSAAALLGAGLPVAIAGLSLRWWVHWRAGNTEQVNVTLALLVCLPVVILLVHGFLGYGIAAIITCSCFMAMYYRPRWVVLVSGALCCVAGLSMFPVYLAARSEIREAVWGGASLTDRVEVTSESLIRRWQEEDDEDSSVYLDAVDRRLNQNYLLGAAVDYMERTGEYFAGGETIWDAVLAMVPRILWPSKPEYAGSGLLVTRFTGIEFGSTTSVGIGHLMELYVNFGKLGMLIGSLVLGVFLGVLDCLCAKYLRTGHLRAFAFWFAIAILFHNVTGNFAEATAGALGAACLCLVIQHLLPAGGGIEREDWSPRPARRPV
jgi:hypothetical protein